jgi:general secretion pathway protein A
MYVDHFKLKNRPFIEGADTSAFFPTTESKMAIARLQHILLARDGAAVVTGGPGVGKSTIVEQAAKAVENDSVIVHIDMRHTDAALIYQMVLLGLGAEAGDGNVADSLHRLRLATKKENEEGRKVTVVIDVNGFTAERANHILRLAHLAGETDAQLNIILLGPHTLHKLLDIPGLIHIRQRVAYRCRVRPLTVAETDEYINKQFDSVKGKTSRILAKGTPAIVYQYVGGVPRLINTLMDAVLSEACTQKMRTVTAELIHDVAKELGWRPLSKQQPVPAKRPVAKEARTPATEVRDKPPVLEVAAAKEDLKPEEDDNPDHVKTNLIFEQPLEINVESDDSDQENSGSEDSDHEYADHQTTTVSDNSSDSDQNGDSAQIDEKDPGTMTRMLRSAAETLESDLDTLPEPAAGETNDEDDGKRSGGVPKMSADDTGATGMLKLEDLDARFAETVFGEDAGMVNALEELAKMRGLDDDSELALEPEQKTAESK